MPIDASAEVGAKFRGVAKRLSYERLWAFSGGPFTPEGWPKKNLHTDPETATRVGLDAAIASGTQFQGHLVELLVDLFGPAWLEHGTMDVRFVRGVSADETLVSEAVVTARELVDGRDRFTLDVRCINEQGDAALVGTATGLVS